MAEMEFSLPCPATILVHNALDLIQIIAPYATPISIELLTETRVRVTLGTMTTENHHLAKLAIILAKPANSEV